MKLQQLRFLCEVADQNLNLSEAAKKLHTSQPGISKQIRLLEEELKTDLLVRRRNRIVGLTAEGADVIAIARRMLQDSENLRRVATDSSEGHSLVIATTHVHARYVLLQIIKRFKVKFPKVRLAIKQGTPDQIAHWVEVGDADFGLSTLPSTKRPDLVALPCFLLARCVLVNSGHPLLHSKGKLTLRKLSEYPLIALDSSFAAGVTILDSFRSAGLDVNVVLTATDSDVIKAYVASGIGIATPPSISFDTDRDHDIRAIDAGHLFPPSLSYLWLHKNYYLPSHVTAFIAFLSAKWTKNLVMEAVKSGDVGGEEMAVKVSCPSDLNNESRNWLEASKVPRRK